MFKKAWPWVVLLLLLAGNIFQYLHPRQKTTANVQAFSDSTTTVALKKYVTKWPVTKTKLQFQAEIKQLTDRRHILLDSLKLVLKDTFPHPDYRRIYDLNIETDKLSRQLQENYMYSACVYSVLPVAYEWYHDTLGINQAFCTAHNRHVGQLQWCYGLADSMKTVGTAGHVSGQYVGSGCMISPDLFLTAGHCLEFNPDDTDAPRKNGMLLNSDEAAHLMRVTFNHQVSKLTGAVSKDTTSFPILKVEEYRYKSVDYAILRLGTGTNQRLPGDTFGYEPISNRAPVSGEPIAIIQYPNLDPDAFTKKIGVGIDDCPNPYYISYPDMATEASSSGAPIISRTAGLIGIHLQGDCRSGPGEGNQGITLFKIIQSSPLLQSLTKRQ